MAAIASRYARALVEVVLEQKTDPDIARQQLNAIVNAVHESHDLRRVWESPAVSAEQKRAVLDAVVGQIGAAKPIRNFIAIRSEEHTSELQSLRHLVCRLLLEK